MGSFHGQASREWSRWRIQFIVTKDGGTLVWPHSTTVRSVDHPGRAMTLARLRSLPSLD